MISPKSKRTTNNKIKKIVSLYWFSGLDKKFSILYETGVLLFKLFFNSVCVILGVGILLVKIGDCFIVFLLLLKNIIFIVKHLLRNIKRMY